MSRRRRKPPDAVPFELPSNLKVKEFGISIPFSDLLRPELLRIYGEPPTFPAFRDSDEWYWAREIDDVPRPRDSWVLIGPCTVLNATPRALRIKHDLNSFWVPKSQLHPEENELHNPGDQGMLICREWVAKEKGLL